MPLRRLFSYHDTHPAARRRQRHVRPEPPAADPGRLGTDASWFVEGGDGVGAQGVKVEAGG